MIRNLLLSFVLLSSRSAIAAEPVRLAPPEAMFRESITLEQFVHGTLRFVLLHEAGHGFVDLYSIPVLGREEDAADRFATWWLAPDGGREDGADAIAAVEWWLALGKQSTLTREQLAWWDEHGVDEQRGWQIICLLYGTDPQTMRPLATRFALPEDQRDRCVADAAKNDASWRAYLSEQSARMPLQLDGFIVPVLHHEPTTLTTAAAADLIRHEQLLEDLAAMLKQFRFPEGRGLVRLQAKDCGAPNAFWIPGEQSIVLCHELVALIADVGVEAGFKPGASP